MVLVGDFGDKIVHSTQQIATKIKHGLIDSKFNKGCAAKSHGKSKHWNLLFWVTFEPMQKFKFSLMNIQCGGNNASGSLIPIVLMRAQPEFDILTKQPLSV